MMKTALKTLIIAFYLLTYSSCNPFGLQGPQPAFIDIPKIEFIHPLEEGPRSHEINHVEIFFENFSIGYYELPVNIAVIPTQEESSMVIRPAIEFNGGATDITAYRMMSNYELVQSFEIGETYEIIPQFDYADNVVFDYVETFEFNNTFNFDTDGVDTTQTILSSESAASGNLSCLFRTDPDEFIQAGTNFAFSNLAGISGPAFVEFEYKSDLPVKFGITTILGGQEINFTYFNLASRSEWNKVYLSVERFFADFPAQEYRLYFEMDGRFSQTPSSLFIDNIKLLHIP